MDNNNNQNGQQLQMEVRPEVATGIYSNFAVISHSSSEFTIDFASILPGPPKANVVSRVIMAPEHAVRLLHALQENLMRYDQQYDANTGQQQIQCHIPSLLSSMFPG